MVTAGQTEDQPNTAVHLNPSIITDRAVPVTTKAQELKQLVNQRLGPMIFAGHGSPGGHGIQVIVVLYV
jgi:hypothetical protein